MAKSYLDEAAAFAESQMAEQRYVLQIKYLDALLAKRDQELQENQNGSSSNSGDAHQLLVAQKVITGLQDQLKAAVTERDRLQQYCANLVRQVDERAEQPANNPAILKYEKELGEARESIARVSEQRDHMEDQLGAALRRNKALEEQMRSLADNPNTRKGLLSTLLDQEKAQSARWQKEAERLTAQNLQNAAKIAALETNLKAAEELLEERATAVYQNKPGTDHTKIIERIKTENFKNTRTAAAACGLAYSTMSNLIREHGLKDYLQEFKQMPTKRR